MGAIGGILIADYWVLRRQALSVRDLFALEGRYTYSGGVNLRAMAALGLAIAPVAPGFIRAAMTPGGVVPNPNILDALYTYAWFVTFGISFVVYLLMMKSTTPDAAPV
jgi:NCS1 family nucleobase:cation symporter-1